MRGPDPTETHVTLTAESLRVLAHPLRARLLSTLRRDGPATATELAAALTTNTGATSYHLRKLADVELVVEVGDQPGRQRRWSAAQESHGWTDSDLPDDPDAAAASGWLRRHYWHQLNEKVARWEEYRPEWPLPWRDAAGMSDGLLELTPAELDELTAELFAVIRRYRGKPARPGESCPVSVTLIALPVAPDRPPK